MFFRVCLFLACRTISSKIPKSLGKKGNRRNSNVMLVHELRKKKNGVYSLEYINGKNSPPAFPNSEAVAFFKSTGEKIKKK